MKIIIDNTELEYTDYDAVGKAEGFVSTDNILDARGAWQYLEVTGLAYSLQGWFGRTVTQLIRDGEILSKEDYTKSLTP